MRRPCAKAKGPMKASQNSRWENQAIHSATFGACAKGERQYQLPFRHSRVSLPHYGARKCIPHSSCTVLGQHPHISQSLQVREMGHDCAWESHWLSMGRLSSSSTCRAMSIESSRSKSPSVSRTESGLKQRQKELC